MLTPNPSLRQRKAVENDHPIAGSTFISSPCGKFKVKCKINSMSYACYEVALLYHVQGFGEQYEVGQEITLYHESEGWTRLISVISRQGNLLELEVVAPVTTFSVTHGDNVKTTHVCEFLGQYCDLYRISYSNPEHLDGILSLQLPNGENFPVRLRWKHDTEICLQMIPRKQALTSRKATGSVRFASRREMRSF